MKKIYVLFFLGCISILKAQVGIETTNPQAQLDIRSSSQTTPANTDGILIPKIDEFPVTNPTMQQDGMLVFVTGNGTPIKGFYYWDQTTTSWISFGGVSTDADWFLENTINAPTDINDNIFTNGNVGIGENDPNYNLHINTDGSTRRGIMIENTSNVNSSLQYGLYNFINNIGLGGDIGIYNDIRSTGTGSRIGVFNSLNGNSGTQAFDGTYNLITGNGSNTWRGTYNNLVGAGNGTRFGSYNIIANSGNGLHYGTYNNPSGNGSGNKYGSYNLIPASAGGTHYGVYASALKSGSFAGYFLGNVSIGTTSTDNYILPASRGTNGQIMQTDSSGNVTWQDPAGSDSDWLEMPGNTPADDINDNIYTLGNVLIGQAAVSPYPLFVDANTNNTAVRIDIGGTDNSAKVGSDLRMTNTGSGQKIGYWTQFTGGGNGSRAGFQSSVSGGATNNSPYYGAFHSIVTTGTGMRYGSYHSLSGGGTGDQYGNYNTITSNTSATKYGTYNNIVAGTGDKYGTYNNVRGNTSGIIYGVYNDLNLGTGDKYGSYNTINATADGTHYGLYSEVLKAGSFAGYFLGNVSVGTSTTDNYILPASRGTNGQIMQTDGAGVVSWVDASVTDSDSINNLSDGRSDNDGTDNGSSIFLGIGAGQNDDQSNNASIGIGLNALQTATNNFGNIAIGNSALQNFNGNNNIGIGYEAMNSFTSGDDNIILGRNIYSGTASSGDDNVIIGNQGGNGLSVGNGNTFIGHGTGRNGGGVVNPNVSGSIYIGRFAGTGETNSSRLHINNSNVSLPLIYGEFDNDLVRINGTLDVNNAYQFPLTDGTANQVLQTDGSGNVSWQTPADTDSINNLLDGVSDDDGTNNGSSIFLGINAGIADDESDNQNVGIGYQSMSTNTFGSSNTAVGYEALTTNSTGSNNVALGRQSLLVNATGQNNTAIGANALSANNSASNNTAIGSSSLSSLTGLLSTGNVAIGPSTLESSTSGRYNTVIGDNALNDNISGEQNVVIGAFAGNNNASGDGNVFIGYTAGTNEFGSNRLYIENSTASSPLIGGDFNFNRVGVNRPIASLSNTFEVGGEASKATAGSWLANSDRRLKKDINAIGGKTALDYLLQLQGVSYYWDDHKTGIDRPKHIQYGFVAQNIQEVFPEKVTEDTLGYLQTAYGDYDAFFVEAIRELKEQLDKKDIEVKTLEERISQLERQVNALLLLNDK